ncbi:hypothetical protein RQP46_006416 [Phenoliferia psychrophenolica]
MLGFEIVLIFALTSLVFARPGPQLSERDLVAADILGGSNSHALINLDILAGVLSGVACGTNAVVGVQVSLLLPGLLDLCLCVNVLQLGGNGFNSCPSCVLGPSQLPRKSKKSQLALDDSANSEQDLRAKYMESHEYKCPGGERACPLGTTGGYECLDTRTSLDSCGGCLVSESLHSPVGKNCLSIPGVMGVACQDSACNISSCLPGYRYSFNRCVRM